MNPIREAEAWHVTCIREAKADCASTITQTENCCSMAIRKAESCCAKWVHSIQLLHAEGMQCLETGAKEEEGKDCLFFLTACGTGLQACPLEASGVLMTPFLPAHGECASGYSVKHSLPGILHLTWICPTGPSLYYPCGTQALTQVQMVIPFSQLWCIHTLIGRHC